ncbi:beta-ketoacyl-[acyl-carrier-protein] synthase family protein [Francisellaceae bacterium]|nr:beta-ketoacyl-[acyl-carrier-protein] synthase family protein [Francisellaceae bacterium]
MKLYLNNIGIINALGCGKEAIFSKLITPNTQTMTAYDKLFSGENTWVAQVKDELVSLPKSLNNFSCRNNKLLATAYAQIKDDVEILKSQFGKARIGIVLGTSTAGIAATENALIYKKKYGKFPEEFNYNQQEIGSSSEFLAEYAGITGVHYTVSTACSSSGKAFSSARRLIESGLCEAVIVGGSDSLCQMTLNGFNCLGLTAQKICNPFSQNRQGLNIGEGAALFILSKNPTEISLTGIGESSDGHHISSPDPEGIGAKMAINQALSESGHRPKDIGYLNLHGTATLKNDEMEAKVVSEIFGSHVPCSSTKPLIGHTLGAASSQELALCWLLLSQKYNPEKILPAQVWDNCYDPNLPPLNITQDNSYFKHPIMMSNSFAFGGSNISIIIEHSNMVN